MTPLVSLITVCYNSSQTIDDTIQSVHQQTYKNIEHIIIDGGSSDETLTVINRSVHSGPLLSEKDNGLYYAMNKGINIAKGDIIGILNADDFFNSGDVVQKIVDEFKSENCEAVYSDLIFVDKKNTSIVRRKWIAGECNDKSFLNGWMPPHPTFYAKKDLFVKYGMYNTDLKRSADYELLIRFLYVHKVKVRYLKGIAVRMRTGGRSGRSILNRLKANFEDRSVWKLNNIKPHWYTLTLKPLRKLKQFLILHKEYASLVQKEY